MAQMRNDKEGGGGGGKREEKEGGGRRRNSQWFFGAGRGGSRARGRGGFTILSRESRASALSGSRGGAKPWRNVTPTTSKGSSQFQSQFSPLQGMGYMHVELCTTVPGCKN